MAAYYIFGIFFILSFVQGMEILQAEPAIIEEMRDALPSASRIVAGQPAAEGQFPFRVACGWWLQMDQSSPVGDSGGPLTIEDADGKRTQVGIVSFGAGFPFGCNSPFPSGYVRPGYYHDWFTEVTGIDFDWDSDALVNPPASESNEDESASADSSESASSEEGNKIRVVN
ncbi:hypothetical protein HF086_007027 [Spodoptera exigua]|uniref:Peptidase S1 domain-containing protein n=1 Tax=Spodoptera exigua TaxID=7107 RepID=A0A922SQS5_SPOEX|nr:hypothetical protein HF086_007027 [Spodoptera exigua]